jgi:integrase
MSAGHIRPRNQKFEVRMYLGVDPVTGKKRYETATAKTHAEARKILKQMLARNAKGPSSAETFGVLVERWKDLVKDKLSPTTMSAYNMYLDRHILPTLKDVPIDQLRTDMLDRLYLKLRRETGLAGASCRKVHNIVHRVLAQGVKWRWLSENVADFVEVPEFDKPEIVPPSPEQVIVLIDVATKKNYAWGTYLRVAAVTGARRGEMCGLRWADISDDCSQVTIRRAVVLDGKGGVVDRSTKTGNVRRVTLDLGTQAMLKTHRDLIFDYAKDIGLTVPDTGYVFSYRVDGSEPMRPDGITLRFIRMRNVIADAAILAGDPKGALYRNIRLHDLRHFVATQALAARMPARTVAGRLGHARTSMTTDVYADWVIESDAEVANYMGNLINPKVGNEDVTGDSETGAE